MYDIYLFDLDGTLLDTLDDLTDSVNYALSFYGLKTRSKEEVSSFVGNGIFNLIKRAIEGGEENPRFAEVFSLFQEHYKTHNIVKTKPYEGVYPMLENLKKAGKKCAVVSNKADSFLKALVQRFFGEYIFIAIGENEREGLRKKPAPDSVLTAIEKLGGGRAVYVGDSEVDIETAKNAEIECICVTWGFRKEEFLRERGGRIFARHPLDIIA